MKDMREEMKEGRSFGELMQGMTLEEVAQNYPVQFVKIARSVVDENTQLKHTVTRLTEENSRLKKLTRMFKK